MGDGAEEELSEASPNTSVHPAPVAQGRASVSQNDLSRRTGSGEATTQLLTSGDVDSSRQPKTTQGASCRTSRRTGSVARAATGSPKVGGSSQRIDVDVPYHRELAA